MTTHCGPHESVIFHGRLVGSEVAVSLCLQPGLQYGFHYGVPGGAPIVAFSIPSTAARGGWDWEDFGGMDWVSLTLPQDGMRYTLWVSRPIPETALPQAQMQIIWGDGEASYRFEPSSVISDLPFD
ncbi:MAG: hypothetical protein AAGD12_10380 [Pseudomonadota bacterium]